jgi:hypothetical protein
VPKNYSKDIKEIVPQKRGFGSVRVEVTIGIDIWSTSLFPDSSNDTYILPIKKSVRMSNHISDGDMVELSIKLVDLE